MCNQNGHSEGFVINSLISYWAAWRPSFGHWRGCNFTFAILITAPFCLKQRSLETLYLGSTSEPGRGYNWGSEQELSNSE